MLFFLGWRRKCYLVRDAVEVLIYLWEHLTAIHDAMFPILGLKTVSSPCHFSQELAFSEI